MIDVQPGVYCVTFTLPSVTTVRREHIEPMAALTTTVNAEL
jgi:hypothetical protein